MTSSCGNVPCKCGSDECAECTGWREYAENLKRTQAATAAVLRAVPHIRNLSLRERMAETSGGSTGNEVSVL